jgi:phage repressor protein C with HTH and peptisase S24 domain
MKSLCNFADKRSGDFSATEHAEEIHMIDPEDNGQPTETNSFSLASLLYNIPYEVRTHRDKYTHGFVSCQEVKTRKCVKVMSEIGKRIRELREVLGLTQKQFGERIGKSWRTVQDWEAGKSSIPDHTLRFISQVFGVSYEWLKTGQGEMWEKREKALLEELEAKTKEVLEKLVRIPVVGRAGAGFPESPADMEAVGYVLVSKETFQKGGKFSVQVHGDSMEPTLHDGDFVVFKTYVGDGTDIPNGKVVVVRNHYGELIVKRLTRLNGSIVLTSDNPKYPPLQPSADLQIVGVAVEAIKRVEL